MEVRRNILLNPGPATTTATVKLAQVAPDICPREKEFAGLMAGLREDLVRVVHGDPERYTAVLFCGSGTLCMDVCLNSLLPVSLPLSWTTRPSSSTTGPTAPGQRTSAGTTACPTWS